MSLLDALVRLAVRHPWQMVLAVVVAALLGLASLGDLRFDAFPDLTNTQVQVVTLSPGFAAEEVEALVTVPLERALGGLPRAAELRSTSRAGVSAISVVFEDGTDLWWARQLVKERVDLAREEIPPAAGVPELGPPSTGLGEVMQYTLASDRHSPPELYRVFQRQVVPQLRTVPGVVEVNVWVSGAPQIEVALDPYDLVAHDLSLGELEATLAASVGVAAAGTRADGAESVAVRALANPSTAAELAEVQLGRGLRLADVAEVSEGSSVPVGLGSADGEGEVLFVMVQLLAGADALSVAGAVRERADELRASLPEGVRLESIYERDKLVRATLGTVETSLIEGGLLVVFCLLLLLGDLRAGLIVASVIPLAMLGAFVGLASFGVSGNLMSLGAIDFGLVVDGTIVLVESVLAAHLVAGAAPGQFVLDRVRAVARPVLFGVAILLLAYLPVLAMLGTEGRLFRPMAVTVLLALFTALILSFTWVPALATLVLRPHGEYQTWLVRAAAAVYRPLLGLSLRWPWLPAGGGAALFALALLAGSRLGFEFVPRLEEGDIVVQTMRLPSTTAEEALEGATRVERVLRSFPEVRRVASRMGSPVVATDPMGLDDTDILVALHPKDTWTTAHDLDGLMSAMAERIDAEAPGALLTFTQPIEMRFNEMLEGITSDVGVQLYGDDLAVLDAFGLQVVHTLQGIEGAADVKLPAVEGVPSVDVNLDPAALGRLGLTASEALLQVEALRRGRAAAEVQRGGFRDPLVLRLALPTAVALDDLPIVRPQGGHLTLGDVAEVRPLARPAVVRRHQGSRRVVVQANVRGRDVGGFVAEARAKIAALERPRGVWITWSGKAEQLATALARTAVTVPIALLGMFLLLRIVFGNVKDASLILLSVPMATSGGLFALALRGLPLSMSAIVGFIALSGVAVMNGVVLLARTRELGIAHPPVEAARLGASERMRPVLGTALVAGIGFLPMALATGLGAEVQRPLATVVIGGLLTATPLTLMVLPGLAAWTRSAAGPAAPEAA